VAGARLMSDGGLPVLGKGQDMECRDAAFGGLVDDADVPDLLLQPVSVDVPMFDRNVDTDGGKDDDYLVDVGAEECQTEWQMSKRRNWLT
jgi:hypothetical protein